ncbi:hypothetical protein O5D80_002498 [Batrachochytrium dendrobatidis]|nr:hypothetical protein O5D80_002498 [Batrachochytrium dendrobatidis]
MRLVDILFVLSVAATVNAILIPADNNDSPQASSTSSQVSGPTDEPNPGTSNEYQQEPMNLSLLSRIRQQPMDQPNPNTFNQGQRPTVIVFGPNVLKQGRKRIIEQPSSSTPSQVSDPIGQVGPNTFDKYQQQPADKTSSSIPKQTQQHPIDATDLNISNQDPQQPIDQSSPSTSSQGRKRPIGDSSSSGAPKRSRKRRIDQPNPSTSDEYWKPLFDIINPNIPSQDQQQPMGESESANTVSNQIAGLSEQDQRTFNRIKQRLVESKKIAKEKRKEYRDYADLKFSQQLALARGEKISEPRYDPKVEKRLKQEYVAARIKVTGTRRNLKRFMKRRGLEFEEPDSDSD